MSYLITKRTKAEKLLDVLLDGERHFTQELVRKVGHTFGGAKRKLVQDGFDIERERHPAKKYQHQYRLVDGPSA